MLKAIVTGGCGFIGSNLCRKLHNSAWEHWDVYVVDDLSSGSKHNIIDGIHYVYKSVQEPGLMNNLVKQIKPDIIFHLAAVPRVSYSVAQPILTTDANLIGTMTILEAVRNNNCLCRIVNSSSSSIYGGADIMPTPEDCKSNPKSPYALQKWQAEEWCRMYASLYGVDVVSLRYFNVIGPGSRFGGAYSTVLSAWMYHLFIDQNSIPFLEGDGLQSRDFCGVENVVQANILAATSRIDRFIGESFNVAQGDSHTLLDCKILLEDISGKNLNLELRPERIGDVRHTLADISNIKNVLEYSPKTDFNKQVECMCKWYKDIYKNQV